MKDVGCMFPSLKHCKLKLIYRARKCMMEEGFFCDVLRLLQLFQFSFVYFLCDTAQCIVCLSHIVFQFLEGIWLGFIFDFVRLELT